MSTQVEARVEVGECDMGHVFIFHRTSEDGDTWMVRAGNHTVGTYDNEARANDVARVLVGEERLTNTYAAETVTDTMSQYVRETQEKVFTA